MRPLSAGRATGPPSRWRRWRPRPPWRWPRARIAAVAAAALVVALGLTVVYPLVGRWLIRTRMVAALEARFGRASIAEIDVGLGHAVLTDVRLGGPEVGLTIAIERIDVDVSTWRSLVGGIAVERVVVRGVTVRVGARGGDRVRALLGGGAAVGARRLPQPDRIDVEDVVVDVAAAGLGASRARLRLPALRRGRDRTWTWSAGELSAGALSLAELAGSARRLADGRLALDGVAQAVGLGPVLATTRWRLTGAIDRGGRGVLTVTNPAADGPPAALQLTVDDDGLGFDGDLALPALAIDHRAVADGPVTTAPILIHARGRYRRAPRELELPVLTVRTGGVTVEVAGTFGLAGGLEPAGGRRAHPRFDARVLVPPAPCAQILAALPAGLAPALVGYRLAGTFALELHAAIDWARLPALEIDGVGGLAGCEVVEAPPISPAMLTRGFTVRREVEPGTWQPVVVAPNNPDYVRLGSVAPVVAASLIATEDPNFLVHDGLDARGLRRALVANLEAGDFVVGSSTITMQLAKNVFLHGHKTLARKLQEVVLAWHTERVLRKPRILELYLNLIEFGPGIYGIGPAAHHYFGKAPVELDAREAAFFSAIVPRPTSSYQGFCTRRLEPLTRDKIRRALTLLVNAGTITSDEWAAATAEHLAFRAADEPTADCLARRDRAFAVLRSRESAAP